MVVSSVAVADGAASVATAAGAITLTATENPVLCGPCAITLWLRVVDLAVTKINTAVIADAINKSKMVTGKSPHLCRSTKKLGPGTGVSPRPGLPLRMLFGCFFVAPVVYLATLIAGRRPVGR
jgi:hypothetical protein